MATKTLNHGKNTETNNIIDLFGEPRDFLPAEYVTDETKRESVMWEVCALPEQYLEVLLMRYYIELGYEEIAFVLDVNPMRAAYTLIRAETLLKESIEKVLERELEYLPVPTDSEPMLTRLFKLDAEAVIDPEIIERIRVFAHNVLYGDDAPSL